MLLLPLAANAFPPKKGDKDCMECHKLDKKDAEAIVKKVVPTGTVTDIKQSPIKGVMVNGKEWKEFDPAKETIRLHDVSGTIRVEASY